MSPISHSLQEEIHEEIMDINFLELRTRERLKNKKSQERTKEVKKRKKEKNLTSLEKSTVKFNNRGRKI